MGACHGLGIAFRFGRYDETFSVSSLADDALARSIQGTWLTFPRNGGPSCESLGTWPLYANGRETMILGEECHMQQAPCDEEGCCWELISDGIGGAL